jgi:hypothetical protein
MRRVVAPEVTRLRNGALRAGGEHLSCGVPTQQRPRQKDKKSGGKSTLETHNALLFRPCSTSASSYAHHCSREIGRSFISAAWELPANRIPQPSGLSKLNPPIPAAVRDRETAEHTVTIEDTTGIRRHAAVLTAVENNPTATADFVDIRCQL